MFILWFNPGEQHGHGVEKGISLLGIIKVKIHLIHGHKDKLPRLTLEKLLWNVMLVPALTNGVVLAGMIQ